MPRRAPPSASAAALRELNPNVAPQTRLPTEQEKRAQHVAPELPLVRIQIALLQHEEGHEIPPTIEKWTAAHLMKDFVDPITKEKRAIVRFDNDEEMDVSWGALELPQRYLRSQMTAKDNPERRPSSQGMTSKNNVDLLCPDEALDCNPSSLEPSSDEDVDFFGSESSSTETLSESSSDEEMLEQNTHSLSNNVPALDDQQRDVPTQSAAASMDEQRQAAALQDEEDVAFREEEAVMLRSAEFCSSETLSQRRFQTRRGKRPTRDNREDLAPSTMRRNLTTASTSRDGSNDACFHPFRAGTTTSITKMKREARRWTRQCQSEVPRATCSRPEGRPLERPAPEVPVSGSTKTVRGSCPLKSKGSSKKKNIEVDPMIADFASENWLRGIRNYASPPLPFSGPEPGSVIPYVSVPSCIAVFEKFWTPGTMTKIIRETNRYASVVQDKRTGQTHGGLDWIPLQYHEFRAYLGVLLFMGVKTMPHRRCYWSEDEPLLQCPVISKLFTRDRFENISRCLHVADMTPNGVDKIGKLRWLHDAVRIKCENLWTLNQQLTVDESMVRYKGQYSPIRQYMPAKPVRFGLKVWTLADAVVKYIWTFKVYCGKDQDLKDSIIPISEDNHLDFVAKKGKGTGMQGAEVVTDLTERLHGRGHIVTTDSFFTSVPLFLQLLDRGIMATGTLKSNRKYVPKEMWDKSITKKKELGWTDSCMHISRKICCAVWKDRVPVLLLSTHAEAEPRKGEKLTVKRKVKKDKEPVPTGPMHLQYQRNMRGVDSADQFRGYYSTLTSSHKWWHRLFHFLLDTAIVNSWIIHCDLSFRFLTDPMTHLTFHMQLAKELSSKWPGRMQGYSKFTPNVRASHGPWSMGKKRRLCTVCRKKCSHTCPGCNGIYICEYPCYWSSHWL